MKPKKYEIDSFEKLVNIVTEENAKRLAIDLSGWLLYIANSYEQMRKDYPKSTKGKLNSEIAKASFIWIDDNEHVMRGTKIINNDTGEIKYYNEKSND